jgi:transcriptional regulator with XRE-family HTH domain
MREFPKKSVSEPLLCELGNRVRKLREERHFSQEGFAEVCGLHRTAMGLIERGMSISRLDTLLLISQALDVPVSRLLCGIEKFQ